ncbi:MAG: ParB/RepB/Spo0J family partition protein [Euryarchaeota archaeon]|nr:ParB/RepB/Spo0J family partition protein [Euryarchaeota archaeon]
MSKIIEQREIPTERLKIDPVNVRKGASDITELEDSIEKYGILEPIIVREKGKDVLIVAGSLRYRAAKNIGLKKIPCIVKEMSDNEAFIESAIENIQRHVLEPSEEAEVYAKAYEIFGTYQAVAKAFTVSERTVNQQLEAARLVGIIRDVKKGKQEHAPVSIPRDITKVDVISRAAKEVFRETPKKQVEMFEALKDRPREDVKRAVTYIKAKAEMEPESFEKKPVKEMVDQAFRAVNVEVELRFDSKVSKGIIKAAEKRDLSWEEIVQLAVEQWLKREGFL